MSQAGVTSATDRQVRVARRLAMFGLTVAIVCVLAAAFSGFGYRMGLWHFRTGFWILRVAFFAALAAGALALFGAILSKGARAALVPGVAGTVIALAFAYVPWQWQQTVNRVPRIHDITTDTENPPQFVAAAKLRNEGDHPVTYDGPEVATQQKEAFPDLAPLVVNAPKERVFEAAQAAAAASGLTVVDAQPLEGRIEATQTSFWYGFTDDLVVRIVEAPEGTRVDVRSKSRVGRSDLGQNAKRVRNFLAKLRAELA
jgi:uncharacterized protein (DUF1499 family)